MRRGGGVVLLMAGASALAGCSAAGPPVATTAAPPVSVALIGASMTGLRSVFGRPVLQRIDGSAQVWLYDSAVCRLDVVLYPGPDGAPRVTAAMPMPDGVSRASCVASLEHHQSGT